MTALERRSSHFCRAPFEKAEILPNGEVHLCCPGWVKESVGNLNEDTFTNIWNGAKAKALRASVLDGSYSNCESAMCPHLQALDIGGRQAAYSPLESFEQPKSDYSKSIADGVVPSWPREIVAVFDLTCNLSCPSCRRETIVYRPGTPEWQNAEKIANEMITGFPQLRRIKLAGNGDPFASRIYWKMLMAMDREKHPQLRAMLHTNGLLFTADRWKELSKAHGLIDTVEVSVDAAQDETYALNRRGGRFEILLERLKYIGDLRKTGEIRRLLVSFVVQANNFREMPAFIELGRSVNADTIIFSRLNNWGTFPHSIFLSRSIHRPEHPQHAEFLKLMNDPIFDAPDVFIGNLNHFRNASAASSPAP